MYRRYEVVFEDGSRFNAFVRSADEAERMARRYLLNMGRALGRAEVREVPLPKAEEA